MIDWSIRAQGLLVQTSATTTVRTDETRVLSVSSAIAGNVPSTSPGNGNPYMTKAQGDECHASGWSDDEITTFLARVRCIARFRGLDDAEHLAERLTLRDRQADDRRMCVECQELEASGRCAAARRGAIPDAGLGLVPVSHLLMRCGAFRQPSLLLSPSTED